MSLFASVSPVKTTQADTIRTGKFTLDSGVYDAVIKMAYMQPYATGSVALVVEFALTVKNKPRKFIERLWVIDKATGTPVKENGEHTFGYQQLDVLSKLALGRGAETLSDETKKVEVKKDVIEDRTVLVDLLNARVKLGIKEEQTNKQEKNAAGKWVDTSELKTENSVDKFFDYDSGQTLAELNANAAAVFIETWKQEFDGKLIDRSKPVAGAPAQAQTAVKSGSLI